MNSDKVVPALILFICTNTKPPWCQQSVFPDNNCIFFLQWCSQKSIKLKLISAHPKAVQTNKQKNQLFLFPYKKGSCLQFDSSCRRTEEISLVNIGKQKQPPPQMHLCVCAQKFNFQSSCEIILKKDLSSEFSISLLASTQRLKYRKEMMIMYNWTSLKAQHLHSFL